MDFVITPYQTVGPIRFGMTRIEVRQALKVAVSEVTKSYLSDEISIEEENFVDYFDELDISVAYKPEPPYSCIGVILYKGANPLFGNRNLLNIPIEVLKDWLELLDDSVKVTIDGVSSYRFGISLDTDSYKLFKDEPPKSVGAFVEGYLETCDELLSIPPQSQ
ncbi:MAG TPA: hypothetical protein V6D34_17370 [Candidatus Sericytochromatia bacterium]